MTRFKLGVIDSSIGNGHMFSFSSFFNGYEESELEKCPFPAIVSYLPNHVTPVEALSKKAEISAVWMDDLEYAKSVARFAKIDSVYPDLDDLIENVDGIILTNDEPVGREAVLDKCLASGKIVFVDKIIARTAKELEKQLLLQRYPGQLYCASSLCFSNAIKEVLWDVDIEYMVFTSPKNWANYGIHIVDTFLAFASLNNLEYEIGKITHGESATERQILILNPGGGRVFLRTEGRADVNFSIRISKNGVEREVIISDPFDAFVKMLDTWLSRNPAETHLSEYKRYDDAVAILGCEHE
jgi:hypothetical protein